MARALRALLLAAALLSAACVSAAPESYDYDDGGDDAPPAGDFVVALGQDNFAQRIEQHHYALVRAGAPRRRGHGGHRARQKCRRTQHFSRTKRGREHNTCARRSISRISRACAHLDPGGVLRAVVRALQGA
jgi:hypothetical protein